MSCRSNSRKPTKGNVVPHSEFSIRMYGKKKNFKIIKRIDEWFVRFGGNAKGEDSWVKTITLRSSWTMLLHRSLLDHFWADAMRTTCHILNRCLIRLILKKTPCELRRGEKPNISYFHPYGWKCFIHNNGQNNLGMFDTRSDKGIFLGYDSINRVFHVFNKTTLSVEEYVHVVFDETNTRM